LVLVLREFLEINVFKGGVKQRKRINIGRKGEKNGQQKGGDSKAKKTAQIKWRNNPTGEKSNERSRKAMRSGLGKKER